ncbi:hypothetical protein Pse7367_1440 [Thalassoporum mexicanum PCC 7367]|uniref:hypothetical protein n=1 Tax=Thalassoporum mexicanum TaxID=3457544 RepID=UPI00029F92ED|nr:hypothetical protein [Pseudanabaena sp. PCC 7367]AFY69731.1 hypothetical protein Pse7367_1440 [Pseudanabaena sp. PCC 7367]
MRKHRLIQLALNLGAIALAAVTVIALQMPRIKVEREGQTIESDRRWLRREQARLDILQTLPRSGFGYNNLIADITFLNFLQYFGDDMARETHQTGYGLSPDYFEIIIEHDPHFVDAYLFASFGVSVYAAQPEKTIAMYEYGLRRMQPEKQPYAYTVWRRKASDELLLLNRPQDAIESYLNAADWADRATFGEDTLPEVEVVAQRSRETAAFLQSDPDSKSARISAWSDVLAVAFDQKTFDIAVAELNKLGIGVRADENGNLQTFSLEPPQSNN